MNPHKIPALVESANYLCLSEEEIKISAQMVLVGGRDPVRIIKCNSVDAEECAAKNQNNNSPMFTLTLGGQDRFLFTRRDYFDKFIRGGPSTWSIEFLWPALW